MSFYNTPTLFVTANVTTALLVTPQPGGRFLQRRKRFTDAHAALTWCQARGVILVYTPAAPAPEKN